MILFIECIERVNRNVKSLNVCLQAYREIRINI